MWKRVCWQDTWIEVKGDVILCEMQCRRYLDRMLSFRSWVMIPESVRYITNLDDNCRSDKMSTQARSAFYFVFLRKVWWIVMYSTSESLTMSNRLWGALALAYSTVEFRFLQ